MRSIINLRLMGMRKNLVIVLLMTFIALALISLMFGAYSGDFKYTVKICDLVENSFSQKLIPLLEKNNSFNFEIGKYNESIVAVEEGQALASVVLRDDGISILKTADDANVYAIENLISNTINRINSNIKIAEVTTAYILKDVNVNNEELENTIYNKAVDHWKYRLPITVKRRLLNINSNKQYDDIKHITIGFILFFSMYGMVFSIGDILEDKKLYTWQRMLISPISKAEILGGNMIVAFITGLFQIILLIMLSKYLLDIDWGNCILGILVVVSAFVFSTTSLGLLLSGTVKTTSQLSALTPIVLTSTSMLGGAMFPLEVVNSKVILFLSNFTPQKWAIKGIEDIVMFGKGFESVILPTIILLTMGILFFVIGVILVKSEQ